MIKVGQIYKQPNNILFVVSYTNENDNEYHILYNDGYTASYYYNETTCLSFDTLIAEYPTWQEAVNSKEFKGE